MNAFKIKDEEVKVCLGLVSAKTLRISILPVSESVKDVFSVIDLDDRDWGEPSAAVNGENSTQAVYAGDFTAGLKLNAEDFIIRVNHKGKPLQNISVCVRTGKIRFPLGKGPLFGLGHGYTRHPDRRGASYDLRVNGLVRGIFENYSATSPTPLVISTEGWSLYFHQPWKSTISLEGETGAFIKNPCEPTAYTDIFVTACEEPADAAREYYKFTGCPPMPPKYAFGYQQSYRTLKYKDTNYVMETAKYMRDNDIPCDTLIYLGTGYCENGWNTRNGNFEFHPGVFPNPGEMMKELHGMNYKISLHITQCHTGLHGSIYDRNVSPMEYDHARHYWNKHIELHEISQNEAWWPDDADEVDMEQRLTRWKMYYEGQLEMSPDTRPFQMQRNTFPGANKYGGIIWTGDITSEWVTLKNQVPIGINAALSASPYWGSDVGGFYSTPEYDGELFMRWFSYSVFTPFIRAHGRPSFLHNPWGFGRFKSLDEMPLELAPGIPHDGPPKPESLMDERVEPFCRKMIKLRYALLPYIYNLSHDALNGIPMIRPLWYYFPNDEEAVSIGGQYMFGESLMVAPVTEKGAQNWEVYFPEGQWYCLFTGERIEGGGIRTVPSPVDSIPVFVRAGGIVPRGPVTQYVDISKKQGFDRITLQVFSGADGVYSLYEDDGISLGYTRGENTVTEFFWNDSEKILSAKGKSTVFPGETREIEAVVMPGCERQTLTIKY